MHDPARLREQLATRLTFFIAGFSTAAWAPLVPLARERLQLDEGSLGLLLLCLGLGSIIAMPVTGVLTTRIGCKAVITASVLLTLLTLPLLTVLEGWMAMAMAIAVFGAALGTVDIAMNLQAIIVERNSGRAMMSGFHGLYSVGGIAGASLVSLLLGSFAISPFLAAGLISAVSLILLVIAMPGLLPYGDDSSEKPPLFAWPKGAVLFIGFLCFLCFLVEGAVLDWSAVFLMTERGSDIGLAGLAYAAFAVAMTLGRLTGDRLRTILGEQRVLIVGGILAAVGFDGCLPRITLCEPRRVPARWRWSIERRPSIVLRGRAHPGDAAELGGDGRDHTWLSRDPGRTCTDWLYCSPDGSAGGVRPAGGRHAVHRREFQAWCPLTSWCETSV